MHATSTCPVLRGALVTTVSAGSPAARAGLRPPGGDLELFNGAEIRRGGDVVVAIGDLPVRSADDVARVLVDHHRPGESVTFVVVRDGRRDRIAVKLGTRPANPDTTP